ncbi:uncharacterized protein METZ01_LOCUS468795, partial [marine metagenome]
TQHSFRLSTTYIYHLTSKRRVC